MTTVLKININDLSAQFIHDLKAKFGKTAQLEIRVENPKHGEGLFSEVQFWQIINGLDWNQEDYTEIVKPAVALLSKLPLSNIYLFQDYLSEKLFRLDTKAHANTYIEKYGDGHLSVDDFLYVRCAVVAEGKTYYEKVLKDPTELPIEISFEPLLSIASEAYGLKTSKKWDYFPIFNYETHSNLEGWK
ncbi:MAG: hypothetical protein RIS64_4044 [Bacteroidota bacterium]|jgi:hypothetical protein